MGIINWELNEIIHDALLLDIVLLEDQLKFFKEFKVRHIYDDHGDNSNDIISALDTRIKSDIKSYNKKYYQNTTRRKVKDWFHEYRRFA